MSRTSLKTVLLCITLLMFGAASAYADNFSIVTSRPSGTDTIDWGQFGPPFTQLMSPADWISMNGAMGTASDSGTLERRDEGNGWDGIFAFGDHLLWNQDNGNAIDIHFNSPISMGGAQIQDDDFGAFMGCVQALGSFGASPVFCVAGNNDGSEMNTAPFIGIQDLSGGHITDLLFTTDVGPNATAINSLSFSASGATTPEPTSMLLLGSGLLTAAGVLKRRRRLP
ncbi:MAG: PEP-CTERM sorting domain-containing protein [Candidatus Korobacteraceae bacterium]